VSDGATVGAGEEFALYRPMPGGLHCGEAESLAIAAYRRWGFLTGDGAARRRAARLHVLASGTLAVLEELVRIGRLPLPQASELLCQMLPRFLSLSCL
jgi:predicted nucleic acid-binding protein